MKHWTRPGRPVPDVLLVSGALALTATAWRRLPPDRPSLLIGGLGLLLFIGVLWLCGHYNTLWPYAGTRDIGRLCTTLLLPLTGLVPGGGLFGCAPGFALCFGLLAAAGLLGIRLPGTTGCGAGRRGGNRLLIVGAGAAASKLISEIRGSPDSGYSPVVCLDDDRDKWGRRIGGVPVLGSCEDVGRVADALDAQSIMIAIPSAEPTRLRTLAALCGATGRTVLRLPPSIA